MTKRHIAGGIVSCSSRGHGKEHHSADPDSRRHRRVLAHRVDGRRGDLGRPGRYRDPGHRPVSFAPPRADSSVSAATNALDIAHDRAVSERRNFVLTFVNPNRIRLSRQEINAAGVVTSTTQVEEFILEGGQTFLKFTGIPDTPDAFGAVERDDVQRHRARHVHERRLAGGFQRRCRQRIDLLRRSRTTADAASRHDLRRHRSDSQLEMEGRPMGGMTRHQHRAAARAH